MRLVLQRVSRASVRVDDETVGEIAHGLLILIGVREGDDEAQASRLAAKIAELRVFPDDDGPIQPLADRGAAARRWSSASSRCTATCAKGGGPASTTPRAPEVAEPLVEAFAAALETLGVRVARGRFGAHMQVELVNDGPVTIVIDSEDLERPRRRARPQMTSDPTVTEKQVH